MVAKREYWNGEKGHANRFPRKNRGTDCVVSSFEKFFPADPCHAEETQSKKNHGGRFRDGRRCFSYFELVHGVRTCACPSFYRKARVLKPLLLLFDLNIGLLPKPFPETCHSDQAGG